MNILKQFLFEKVSEFHNLKKNRTELTPEESRRVHNKKAVWQSSDKSKPTSAVWKSHNKKTGKITYVTNTHRAYNTAPTVDGAISRFHKFIKSTA